MSIHIEQSPETAQKLRKQKTTATITSLLISFIIIALLGTVLGLLTILIPAKEVETIISYQAPAIEDETTNEPKVRVQQRQVPTPPSASSAVANVITTTAPTSVTIPDTNQMTQVESPDFGTLDDFGMGFGFEEAMSSSTSFFGAKVTGTKIAYVIDYSLSMRAQQRVDLMRVELAESVEKLRGGAEYALIFFAGPVWDWTSTFTFKPDGHTIDFVTQADGDKVIWKSQSSTDASELRKVKPSWVKPTEENIQLSLKSIKETPLALGTDWEKPLMKALEMKPQPDVIIFMTDGSSGKSSMSIATEVGRLAKRKSITINTIALMEPKAKEEMKVLAEATGGTAIMVHAGGKEIEDLFTGEVTRR